MPLAVIQRSHVERSRTVDGVEAALLARARAGDPAAVGRIYELHRGRVCSFARRLVGDAAAAEDLVQDAFVHLPELLARRFRGEAPLVIFLLAVVARRARRYIRTAIRRRRLHDRLAALPGPLPETPERDASRRQLSALLVRALDTLPREQRLAFVLRDVEGLSSAEAAAVADVPEATVRTRLFHARRKLRFELGDWGSHE